MTGSESLNRILSRATKEHWATGHFNASESDQMRAIVEAAAEIGTAAIIGTSEGEAKHIGCAVAVGVRDGLRKEFGVPVFLNSDHHKSVAAAKAAFDAGYDSIHIDLSAESFDINIAGTKEIVAYIRKSGNEISVEGELGYLRGDSKIQNQKIEVRPEDYTDPDEAQRFVEATGIDRLAIAVGNIHGLSLDEPRLDIERIRAIRARVPEGTALVLHAGSGIPDDQIKAAIAAGIANIHINTDLRVAYTSALREELASQPDETTPYKFDASARDALQALVKKKLLLFGIKI
ncbi:MAG: ketose-bisphosphate aldolase [Candidatus Sungbacteria bacterium]|nr:ketose-bisphosphate aldolase [Candidatus Sungbacteria bacterium]